MVAYNLIPVELPPLEVDENLLGQLLYVGYSCFELIALMEQLWNCNPRIATDFPHHDSHRHQFNGQCSSSVDF
jgi:hypothetical protein